MRVTTRSSMSSRRDGHAGYVGNLKNGGVGIAPYHDYESQVSAGAKSEVEDLQANIISGEVKVSDWFAAK